MQLCTRRHYWVHLLWISVASVAVREHLSFCAVHVWCCLYRVSSAITLPQWNDRPQGLKNLYPSFNLRNISWDEIRTLWAPRRRDDWHISEGSFVFDRVGEGVGCSVRTPSKSLCHATLKTVLRQWIDGVCSTSNRCSSSSLRNRALHFRVVSNMQNDFGLGTQVWSRCKCNALRTYGAAKAARWDRNEICPRLCFRQEPRTLGTCRRRDGCCRTWIPSVHGTDCPEALFA